MIMCDICEEYHSELDSCFGRDVIEGLSKPQKELSSKYFYDAKGSDLFNRITQLPEYYLTNAETEIIATHGVKMFSMLDNIPFDLYELGCGNSEKTHLLIEALYQTKKRFHYHPIDISRTALLALQDKLSRSFPFLDIDLHEGDYQQLLPVISRYGKQKTSVVLFLGASIGNFSRRETIALLNQLGSGLTTGDLLLIGFDLKKDIDTLTAAYNDRQGVTREFNLNLLRRINTSLGADFDLKKFIHHEIYLPVEGAMRSYLISTIEQTVQIPKIGLTVKFDAYEPISVERSVKFSLKNIANLAVETGFHLEENFLDNREYFVDSLWRRESLM